MNSSGHTTDDFGSIAEVYDFCNLHALRLIHDAEFRKELIAEMMLPISELKEIYTSDTIDKLQMKVTMNVFIATWMQLQLAAEEKYERAAAYQRYVRTLNLIYLDALDPHPHHPTLDDISYIYEFTAFALTRMK